MNFITRTDLNITETDNNYIAYRKENNTVIGYELKAGNTVYDFNGLTFDKDLYINGTSITVKNAIIPHQLIVENESRHCKFENVVFKRDQTTITGTKPLVSFGYGTAATTFDKCTFIGGGDYNYAMNGSIKMVNGIERAVNDTLVMKNCTFNNLNCVIRATKKFNCVIEGCRFNNVTSIIHNDGVWYNGQTTPQSYTAGLNTNIVINGISINNVNYIFRSRSTDTNYANQSIYAFANIVINGILGEVTSAVVDFQKGGSVNLEYNAPITDKTKLCSKDSNCYFSSNVKALDNTEHKVLSTYFDHTIDLELEPDEIYAPFGDNIVNVEQVSWDVAGIEVYIEQNNFVEVTESSDTGETICGESKRITLINTINKKYKNSNFNYFGKFKIHNVSSIPLKTKMTIRTANLI